MVLQLVTHLQQYYISDYTMDWLRAVFDQGYRNREYSKIILNQQGYTEEEIDSAIEQVKQTYPTLFGDLRIPIVSDIIDTTEGIMEAVATLAQVLVWSLTPVYRVDPITGEKYFVPFQAFRVLISIPIFQLALLCVLGPSFIIMFPKLVNTVPNLIDVVRKINSDLSKKQKKYIGYGALGTGAIIALQTNQTAVKVKQYLPSPQDTFRSILPPELIDV